MDFGKIFHFLIDLEINNNRNWFNDNKLRYEEAKDEFVIFLDDFLSKLKDIDVIKEYYGFSNDKAKDALKILSKEQIKYIKEKLFKGGKK